MAGNKTKSIYRKKIMVPDDKVIHIDLSDKEVTVGQEIDVTVKVLPLKIETTSPDYKLGPLPWSKEFIEKEYWRDMKGTKEAINEHPGYFINREIEATELSLDFFLSAVSELMSSIDGFKKRSAEANFWTRPKRHLEMQLMFAINKALFSVTISAMALVDRCRVLTLKYPVPAYDERVEQCFDRNEEHQFVQGLRNYMAHVRIAESNWQTIWDEKGRRVNFLLRQKELFEGDKWNSLAKSFIEKYPDGIDVETLLGHYRDHVAEFHFWFHEALRNEYGDIVDEYKRYRNVVDGISANTVYSLLLQQVITQKLDPYMYLDKYLSPDEIETVLALPNNSKEQVDNIIALLEECNSCDDSLRQLAYRAFKVDQE